MELDNTETKKRERVTKVDLPDSASLIIKPLCYQKIMYLCQKIQGLEWSAVLFIRKTKGELNDPKNLSFEALDLWLMDIGSTGFTSFKYDETILTAYEHNPDIDPVNPQAEGVRCALIHSHHNMSTFYSKDDQEEVEDNTPEDVDMYLSLIVNTKLEWIATVSFRGERFMKNNFKRLGTTESQTFETTEKVLYIIKTNVFLEGMLNTQNRVEELWKGKLEKEQREKEEAEKKRQLSLPMNTGGGHQTNGWRNGHGASRDFPRQQKESFQDLEKDFSRSTGNARSLELPKLLMLNERYQGDFEMALNFLDAFKGDSIRKFKNYFKNRAPSVLRNLEEEYNQEYKPSDYAYNLALELMEEIEAWRGRKQPIYKEICSLCEDLMDYYNEMDENLTSLPKVDVPANSEDDKQVEHKIHSET